MSLISAAEVNSIAFVTPITESQILPVFISTAETKFIIPLVTKIIYDKIIATPADYTTLVDNYIKPYLAFSVKYMFYNQLLTETNTFPTSDEQRSAALQEVLTIMEVNRNLLSEYLNANIFETPVTSKVRMVSGFRTGDSPSKSSSTTSSPVSESLAAASLDTLSDDDTLNFIQFTTGLLKKITWSNLKITMRSFLGTMATVDHWEGTQAEYDALGTYDTNTLYFIYE